MGKKRKSTFSRRAGSATGAAEEQSSSQAQTSVPGADQPPKKKKLAASSDKSRKGLNSAATAAETKDTPAPSNAVLSPMHQPESNLPSAEVARRAFAWLIYPVTVEEFYAEYFEKDILYIPRHPDSIANCKADAREGANLSADYYKGVLDEEDVRTMLSDEELAIQYGTDIDITKYEDGVRKTLNGEGRAEAEGVFEAVAAGCSVRFLCPQRFRPPLWKLIFQLEEFWGAGSGANSYYTPGGTQGFAPHYDEVDIYVVQTAGAKRWRLYPPRDQSEVLAEYSSNNFAQSDIGEPILDVVLRQGDFLYAPRGTIHQCVACPGQDSLHVTISTQLKNSWAEFLRRLAPRAIQLGFEDNLLLRKALPRDMYKYMGVSHSDKPDERRQQFQEQAMRHLAFCFDPSRMPLDAAVDAFGCDFMHGRVPPVVPIKQQKLSFENCPGTRIQGDTKVRLAAEGVARLTIQETELGQRALLHHIMDNSRRFKETPLSYIDCPLSYAPALEKLISAYPGYTRVDMLEFLDEPQEGADGEEQEQGRDPEELAEIQVDLVDQLFKAGVLHLEPGAVKVDHKQAKALNQLTKFKPNKKKKLKKKSKA